MDRYRISTLLVALTLLFASGYLVYLRGGILAWLGVAGALFLLAKHYSRPAKTDVVLALGCAAIWTVSWAAAWGYVRSTWESGEVVQVHIQVGDEVFTARTWILDIEGDLVMYYEAPPSVGRALLENAPVTIERDDQSFSGCADATRADDLPEAERATLLGEMDAKYGERNRATVVFYAVIGVERDRLGLVVRLKECS